VPGVSVGLIADGEEVVAGFGVTNVDHPLPVDGDTLFQIGSITKTVTATALMRLVEQGKVGLDVPVRAYLPGLRLRDEAAAAGVTLRHLLTHTAGWFGDLFVDTGVGDDALARYVDGLADVEQLTPLGTVWAYSNSGFALAARVMEVATGKTAEDAITDLVLRPLDMTRSFFFARDAITHRVAAGHFVYEGVPAVARPWHVPRSAHAIGGVVSSARDMLKYARFHLGDGSAADGTRLLSAEAVRLMRTPQTAGALDARRGLGWTLDEVGGLIVVSHGGATIGQQAHLALVPEREMAVIVLTNSAQGSQLHQGVTRWAYRAKLGVAAPAAVAHYRPSGELAAYAGVYESPGHRYELKLETDELVLYGVPKVALAAKFERKPPPPPPAHVAFCARDRIVVLDGPTKDLQGEFLRDAGGAIEWFRIGSRIHRRS
jgi:CubicO group peptidase (beta-lactamase class C family)